MSSNQMGQRHCQMTLSDMSDTNGLKCFNVAHDYSFMHLLIAASSRNWRDSRDIDRRGNDADRYGGDYDGGGRYRSNTDESNGRRIECRRPRVSGSTPLDEDSTQGRPATSQVTAN